MFLARPNEILASSKYKRRSIRMSDVNDAPKIIIAGAPASGKGTQCEVIKQEFGVVHLSTGDILRAAVKEGTPLGKQAKEYMDAGQLVPDTLIIDVVKDRLSQEDCKNSGWLLDGFPRTKSQAEALSQANFNPDCFILLDVPQEVLVERVTGRRTDPETGKIYHLKFSPPENEEVAKRLVQRSDDTAEKIIVRYQEFQSHIESIRDNYKDKLTVVDGTLPAQSVSQRVTETLRKALEEKEVNNDEDEGDSSSGQQRGTKVSTNLGRVNPYANIGTIALGTATLFVVNHLLAILSSKMKWSFPASLSGMMILFSILLTASTIHQPTADQLYSFLLPSVTFLKTWLALFFVPPLVILPLKRSILEKSVGKLSSLIVVGFAMSLSFSAVLSQLLCRPGPLDISADVEEVKESVVVVDGRKASGAEG